MAEINGKQVLLGCKLNLTLGVFDYDTSAIYNKGMAVSYSGGLYTPLEDGVTGISPSSDASKWKRVLGDYLKKAQPQETQHIYATMGDNKQKMIWWDGYTPHAWSFPQRISDGRIKGGPPIDGNDLTTKDYVDEKVADSKLYRHKVELTFADNALYSDYAVVSFVSSRSTAYTNLSDIQPYVQNLTPVQFTLSDNYIPRYGFVGYFDYSDTEGKWVISTCVIGAEGTAIGSTEHRVYAIRSDTVTKL